MLRNITLFLFMVFVYSCHFLVAKTNPSTAYAVPLPLGKGGIKKPAQQKQKHTVRARTVTNTYEPAQALNFARPFALSSLKGAPYGVLRGEKSHKIKRLGRRVFRRQICVDTRQKHS